MSRTYLLGALHDATERKYTYRLSQKHCEYVDMVASMIHSLGHNAWTYREGKSRNLHVVEFSKQVIANVEVSSKLDKQDYVQGYFDADGSVPIDPDARMYIYFAQQDKADLTEVKTYLGELGVATGKLHQPSNKADPDYWRFYVSTASFGTFVEVIGSRHPRKRNVFREKIRSTPRCEPGIT